MPSYEDPAQFDTRTYQSTETGDHLDLFMRVPGVEYPGTVMYAGSGSDISLAKYFGTESVVHVDHNSESISNLQRAGFRAIQTTIPEYAGKNVDLVYTQSLGQQGWSHSEIDVMGLDDPQLNANRVYSKCVEVARYLIICNGDGGARRVAHDPRIRLLGGIIRSKSGELIAADEGVLLKPEEAAYYLGDCTYTDEAGTETYYEHPNPSILNRYGHWDHVSGTFMFEKHGE